MFPVHDPFSRWDELDETLVIENVELVYTEEVKWRNNARQYPEIFPIPTFNLFNTRAVNGSQDASQRTNCQFPEEALKGTLLL